MTINGPAIKGDCFTWRSHPATCPGTIAMKLPWWHDEQLTYIAVSGGVIISLL
jgi:hypothetical protein